MRGGDPGRVDFVPGVLELQMYGKNSDPEMGPYPSRVALAPRTPTDQQSDRGVVVSTPCGAVSSRGVTVSVPGVLEL